MGMDDSGDHSEAIILKFDNGWNRASFKQRS